ncbi:serine-rich adhesin for platelets [Polyergus mexicanus]|uniref:serine-rich adhesin for platelets n=1 Tax=Polyergus mexicanus TaxID=615972 RepID=UPI0038B4BF63
MAKRRTINRLSKRFSKNKSNDSISSKFLDPDTNIISEEPTHWWKNLDENMSSQHSFIHNSNNETSQQLNLNSELESNHNISQWWKHLESPNSRSDTSRRSRSKLSTAINTHNILETSTSESEKELSLRKRKVPLRIASRKSNSKAFLDALNDTEVAIPIKWRMKQTRYSNLYSNSDKEVLEKKLDENKEDNSNLSLNPSPNILKSKPYIFKRRRDEGPSGENPFQDIVKDDSLNAKRKSVTFEKKTSKRSIHQNINTNKDHIDDQRETIQVSQTLPLENNEAGPSNLSTSNTMLKNNVAFDINKTVETSDESDFFEISKRKRFKFKSHLMQRVRRSMSNDLFKDALEENRDTSLSKHDQDKEIDIHSATSPLKTKSLSSPSKKIVNRSKRKTDVTHENMLASSPNRRSPRSLKKTKKHLLDITTQVQDNIEQNISNSSLDNEFDFKKPVHLKLKSKIPILHKKNLTNPFKKILMEDGNINARKSNIAVSAEDNRISVEQDKVTTEISQGHEQVMVENYSLSKTGSVSEDSNISLMISPSNNVENVSENLNVQPNRLSESNDTMNVSKSNSRRNIIIEDRSNVSQKKRLSFSRKSIRDISETLKDHTNIISLADRTNINEIEACKVISDHKFFITKDASSTSNVRNLLTSQFVNAENFEKIKAEVDRLKIREMAAIKMATEKKESTLKATTMKLFGATRKQSTKKNICPKVVDKAYLVNGKVYKPPRLPRPKHWATDHLYKFLWKHMEPKYQLSTRVRSEKFMLLLSKIVSIINRRKKYENYKFELEALMKEMARLNIINTRNDFHHFCQDFLPYEFRIKVVPMLLPGNKQNIPFEPEKLHTPLLEET